MKLWIKAIVVFMVAVLCLGGVSMLFDGSDSTTSNKGPIINIPTLTPEPDDNPPEETVCTHIDADDNELCDLCGESYSDGIEFAGVPHHVNPITGYEVTKLDLNYPGFVTLGMFKNGVSLTIDEKFIYHGTSDAVVNDRFFGFNVEKNSTYQSPEYLLLENTDYITIDFDISTENNYPYDFHIWPVFRNYGGEVLSYEDKWFHLSGAGTGFSVKQNTVDEYQPITSTPHFTYVIDVANGDFYVYIDGVLWFTYLDTFADAVYLDYIRIYVENGSVPEDGESISIDNIAVYGFGNGDGSYSGAIVDAINDSNKSLTECKDSVLYTK